MNLSSRTVKFRNHNYHVAIDPDNTSSDFTHVDEAAVRERDWTPELDSCILDIGAAYGSYLLAALAIGAGFGFAWSPQVNEKEVLSESLRLNNWQSKAVVYRSGFYSKPGILSTTRHCMVDEKQSDEDINVGLLDEWYAHHRNFFLSRHIPFSSFWMKLDVEGAELEILTTGTRLIKELKPTICVENHEQYFPGIGGSVRVFLERLGYTHVSTHPYHAVSHSKYSIER